MLSMMESVIVVWNSFSNTFLEQFAPSLSFSPVKECACKGSLRFYVFFLVFHCGGKFVLLGGCLGAKEIVKISRAVAPLSVTFEIR
jgi:hypothetical protein